MILRVYRADNVLLDRGTSTREDYVFVAMPLGKLRMLWFHLTRIRMASSILRSMADGCLDSRRS